MRGRNTRKNLKAQQQALCSSVSATAVGLFPAISGARLATNVQPGAMAVNNQQIPGRTAGYLILQMLWDVCLQ